MVRTLRWWPGAPRVSVPRHFCGTHKACKPQKSEVWLSRSISQVARDSPDAGRGELRVCLWKALETCCLLYLPQCNSYLSVVSACSGVREEEEGHPWVRWATVGWFPLSTFGAGAWVPCICHLWLGTFSLRMCAQLPLSLLSYFLSNSVLSWLYLAIVYHTIDSIHL